MRKVYPGLSHLSLVIATAMLLSVAWCSCQVTAAGLPIASIDLNYFGHYNAAIDNPRFNGLEVIGEADVYHLTDGTTWSNGAGSIGDTYSKVSSVAVSGSQIAYALDLPIGSQIYLRVDYDNGSNSSWGRLVSTDTLVLHATLGSSTATLAGYGRITLDQYANYTDDRFHFFDAPIGNLVPFSVTYTLDFQTWTPTTLNGSFTYSLAGTLDFTNSIPEPSTLVLFALGLGGLVAMRWRRRSWAR